MIVRRAIAWDSELLLHSNGEADHTIELLRNTSTCSNLTNVKEPYTVLYIPGVRRRAIANELFEDYMADSLECDGIRYTEQKVLN